MQTKNTEHVEEQLEEEHAYELCTQRRESNLMENIGEVRRILNTV